MWDSTGVDQEGQEKLRFDIGCMHLFELVEGILQKA